MNKLETLLKSNKLSTKERWYPSRLENYIDLIKYGALSDMNYETRRNIGYSLQYLEFLTLQFEELVLSSVLEKMLFKNYIVIAVSVVEALLENIIKHSGIQSLDYWEKIREVHSDNFKIDGENQKFVTQVFKERTEPIEIQMKLDDIIKKIRDRNKKKDKNKKLLNLKYDELLALDRFRKLRNKVHLSNIESSKTNWHEFSEKEYVTVKFLLYTILTDEKLENAAYHDCIDFLILNLKEQRIIENFSRIQEN